MPHRTPNQPPADQHSSHAHLVNVHNSPVRRLLRPSAPTVTLFPRGKVAVYKRNRQPVMTGKDNQPPSRGAVVEMSRKSRRRLMQRLATIRSDILPLFITLTWPDEQVAKAGELGPEIKRQIDVLGKRLLRWSSVASVVWRVEWKPRKSGRFRGVVVPHVHALVWRPVPACDSWQARFDEWCRQQWHEIAGEGNPAHKIYGTDVRLPGDGDHVMRYVSKYVAKESSIELPEGSGRAWGVIGRRNLPVDGAIVLDVSKVPPGEVEKQLVKMAEGYQPPEENETWVMFGDAGITLLMLLTAGAEIQWVSDSAWGWLQQVSPDAAWAAVRPLRGHLLRPTDRGQPVYMPGFQPPVEYE